MTATLPPRPGEGRSRGQRRGRDSHPFGGPIGPKRFSRPCGSASRPTRSRSCLRVSASTVAPLTPAREEKQEATTDDASYCFPCKAAAPSRRLHYCSVREAIVRRCLSGRWFGEEEMGGARLERATSCL